jgi:hypothetical protein
MSDSMPAPAALRQASQLVASACLRDPSRPPAPFLSRVWREGWQQLQDQHASGGIPFTAADPLLDGLLPQLEVAPSQLVHYSDVIWRRGQAGLFSTASGLLLEDSYPFRYRRKRQCPTLVSSKLELTCSALELPSLERVIYCPSLACRSLHAWITQALPYAWPWFDPRPALDLTSRVVIGTADQADDPWLSQITARVRSAHGLFCLSEHLPASLRLDDVLVPTPAYSLEAGFCDGYLALLDAWCQQCLATSASSAVAQGSNQRLMLTLDGLPHQLSGLVSSLEHGLAEAGWIIRDLRRDGLKACFRALAGAEQVVTFDPLLAWLCQSDPPQQQLLILGCQPPGLDVFQMIRRRKLQGHWLALRPDQLDAAVEGAGVHDLLTSIESAFS